MKRKLATLFTVIIAVIVQNSCNSNQESTVNTAETNSVNNPPIVFRQSHESDSLRINGILICAHCYALNKENIGRDHHLPENGFVTDCASKCAGLGYPIAVLSEDSLAGTNVWVIRSSGSLFGDYMGRKTVVEGSLVSEGVIEPNEILVATKPGHWQILY